MFVQHFAWLLLAPCTVFGGFRCAFIGCCFFGFDFSSIFCCDWPGRILFTMLGGSHAACVGCRRVSLSWPEWDCGDRALAFAALKLPEDKAIGNGCLWDTAALPAVDAKAPRRDLWGELYTEYVSDLVIGDFWMAFIACVGLDDLWGVIFASDGFDVLRDLWRELFTCDGLDVLGDLWRVLFACDGLDLLGDLWREFFVCDNSIKRLYLSIFSSKRCQDLTAFEIRTGLEWCNQIPFVSKSQCPSIHFRNYLDLVKSSSGRLWFGVLIISYIVPFII